MSSPQPPSQLSLTEFLDKINEVAERQAATVQPDDTLAATAEKNHYDVEAIKQHVKELVETHDLRKAYLPRLFWMIVSWLIVVVLFVLAASIKWITLSDSVLIAFITSTTVSVLGLFIVAARWLFPQSGNKEK